MTVGRTTTRSRPTVSIDSAKITVTPCARYTYDTRRSNEWLSGRNDSDTSSGPTGTMVWPAIRFDTRLWCESITPLGSPVVPDV